jgi:hypothetical protein
MVGPETEAENPPLASIFTERPLVGMTVDTSTVTGYPSASLIHDRTPGGGTFM